VTGRNGIRVEIRIQVDASGGSIKRLGFANVAIDQSLFPLETPISIRRDHVNLGGPTRTIPTSPDASVFLGCIAAVMTALRLFGDVDYDMLGEDLVEISRCRDVGGWFTVDRWAIWPLLTDDSAGRQGRDAIGAWPVVRSSSVPEAGQTTAKPRANIAAHAAGFGARVDVPFPDCSRRGISSPAQADPLLALSSRAGCRVALGDLQTVPYYGYHNSSRTCISNCAASTRQFGRV